DVQCRTCAVCLFFFFFQAEDGIRDKLVTGVQTCALPISSGRRASRAKRRAACGRSAAHGARAPDHGAAGIECLDGDVSRIHRKRSEERRVGKECRARGGRGDTKEKKKEEERGERDGRSLY